MDPTLRGKLYNLDVKSDGVVTHLWSLKRPNADLFLRYVFDNFGTVIVWSAGIGDYVHKIVDWLFTLHYPDRVFARDYCDIITSGPNRDHYVKPIYKLFEEPDLRGKVRYDNTFFIDDNTVSTSYNSDNAVTIPKFNPAYNDLHKDDDALLRLIYWFESTKGREGDVRTWDKSKIFTTVLRTSSPLNELEHINYPYQNIYT